ncbi:hypothetical protein [Undibacterium crateris]|uniref:hypothetical protein n=1 Tax=Undibacterium crateris TaxID=2528175 RepID=UPI00138990EA|nr:hypothetical protein [Undibacterium crateris]NDI86907.1 hypothetical protein [Undibacterium crateris]
MIAIFSDNKNKLHTLANRWRSISTALLISSAAALSFIVQSYMFSYSGKTIESGKDQYTFQLNHWNNEIFKTLAEIRHLGIANHVVIQTEPKSNRVTLSNQTTGFYREFSLEVAQLSRQLEYQGMVISNIMEAQNRLYDEANGLDKSEKKLIADHLKAFLAASDKHREIRKNLDEIVEELEKNFSVDESKLSDNELTDIHVKRIQLGMRIYSDKKSILCFKCNSMQFVSDFATASALVFNDYTALVATHNRSAKYFDAIKMALLTTIVCVTAAITSRKEVKSVLNKPNDFDQI